MANYSLRDNPLTEDRRNLRLLTENATHSRKIYSAESYFFAASFRRKLGKQAARRTTHTLKTTRRLERHAKRSVFE